LTKIRQDSAESWPFRFHFGDLLLQFCDGVLRHTPSESDAEQIGDRSVLSLNLGSGAGHQLVAREYRSRYGPYFGGA